MVNFRYYQEDALDACHDAVAAGMRRPLLVLPTGAGKSIVLGQLASDYREIGSRGIILAHVAELVEQNARAVAAVGDRAGVYAAKLKKRDLVSPIVSASVQSVAARLRTRGELPKFDVAFIDEAHRVSRDEGSQYHKVLEALGVKVCIGLTATPYRLDSGRLDRGERAMFDGVAYEIDMEELVEGGYLSPMVARPTEVQIDTAGLHTRAGEFISSEMEEEALRVIFAMTADLIKKTTDRRCTIVFTAGVKSAEAMTALLIAGGFRVALLTGETPDAERAQIVADVKAGKYQYVVNVAVATTGFDAPNIDCVALCRPTQSTGLYIQMVGRGTRLAEGKDECIVLDYGGNIARLGPPHAPFDTGADFEDDDGEGGGQAVEKECPACGEMVHASTRVCGGCGYWFPQNYAACKADGLMLPGGRKWLQVEAFAAEKVEGADAMRLAYMVEGGVMLHEEVEFVGDVCPVRWRQVGGYSKTIDKAEQECEHMDGPHAVLAVKEGDDVTVGSACMRDPRRRR